MNTFEREKDRIKVLQKQKKDLQVDIDELEATIKSQCIHPPSYVVEIPYNPRGSHDWDGEISDPPYRICKICGFKEEGWGYGYEKLDYDDPIAEASRSQGLSIHRMFVD